MSYHIRDTGGDPAREKMAIVNIVQQWKTNDEKHTDTY